MHASLLNDPFYIFILLLQSDFIESCMQATSSNDETFNSKIFSNSAPEGEFFFEANVILSTRPLPPPLSWELGPELPELGSGIQELTENS